MSKSGFEWEPQSPDDWTCHWNEMYLHAKADGRWWVMTDAGDICASSDQQAAGQDAQEAMLRAQGVAIILQRHK